MQRGTLFTLADLPQFDYVTDPELCLISKTDMFTPNQIWMPFTGFSVAKNPLCSLGVPLVVRQITEALWVCHQKHCDYLWYPPFPFSISRFSASFIIFVYCQCCVFF